MKSILTISLVMLVSGCVSLPSVAPSNIIVREGVLSNATETSIAVKDVVSSSDAMSAVTFRDGIVQSLSGQSLLASAGESAGYSLSANYLKHSAPSWGTKTTVSVDIEYALEDNETGAIVFSGIHNEACVSSITLSETLASISLPDAKEIINATTNILLYGQGYAPVTESALNATERTATPGSTEDIAMGFPRESTPISSEDAVLRGVFARECAIRKSIFKIMTDAILYDQSKSQ